MKILIDNADIQEIKKAYEYFPITGVTCNPTILKRTGRNPYDVLKEIQMCIRDRFHGASDACRALYHNDSG